MNKRDFIKSAAIMTGATAVTPLASASVMQGNNRNKL
jgi:hypothetical protein